VRFKPGGNVSSTPRGVKKNRHWAAQQSNANRGLMAVSLQNESQTVHGVPVSPDTPLLRPSSGERLWWRATGRDTQSSIGLVTMILQLRTGGKVDAPYSTILALDTVER
jgi:hypothetical protein